MIELPAGRISGRALRALVASVRKTPAKHVAARILRAQLGIDALRLFQREARERLPSDFYPTLARAEHGRPSAELGVPESPDFLRTAGSLQDAYREGRADAVEVTQRALRHARACAARTPSLGAFTYLLDEQALAAARSTKERLEKRGPLSPLDGVPIPVKEEVNVEGVPTRLGTAWLPETPALRDCVAVRRLREAGAVIVGQTAMTEYGLTPLGNNPHRKMPRNALNSGHLAGGSSTGSAVAVATGVAPLALGADGGGSVRIPAAYNGVFGLKPTFGRIPLTGHGMPWGTSLVHLGPIGASTYDLAVFTEITAGPDMGDPASLQQPALEPGELVRSLGRGVKGLRIGVDDEQWSRAPDTISGPCREALSALEREGAILVPIRTRLAQHAPAIGYITIGLEGYSAMLDVRGEHMDDVGLDLQLTLTGLDTLRCDEYLFAQRLRGQLRREIAGVLRDVDVLALPTSATLPPPVTEQEERSGFIDPPALDATCRFIFLANVVGLPAGTAPVAVDRSGLPIGLQIVGDAWDEACVLQVLAHLERTGAASVPKSPAYGDLLA